MKRRGFIAMAAWSCAMALLSLAGELGLRFNILTRRAVYAARSSEPSTN